MLLDTLKEEESGVHVGDDLLKTMEEIAFRSASERRERTPEKLVKTFKCRLGFAIRLFFEDFCRNARLKDPRGFSH